MNSNALQSTLAATAAILIALVFLRAAWHKLRDIETFAAVSADYQLLPAWAIGGVARALIGLELASAVALLVPPLEPVGAELAMTLLLLYSAAISVNLLRGHKQFDCGCGGTPQGLGWGLVARNLVLVAIATLPLESQAAGATEEWVLAAAGGFTLWIGFLLVEQVLANASRMTWANGEKAS
jgi:Methylamine utilisation protein MauE